MLAQVYDAEIRAEKIAARRAALGERVLELAAECVAAVASKAAVDALQAPPPPPLRPRRRLTRRRG